MAEDLMPKNPAEDAATGNDETQQSAENIKKRGEEENRYPDGTVSFHKTKKEAADAMEKYRAAQ